MPLPSPARRRPGSSNSPRPSNRISSPGSFPNVGAAGVLHHTSGSAFAGEALLVDRPYQADFAAERFVHGIYRRPGAAAIDAIVVAA